MHRCSLAAALALVLPAPGCCSLARLFCGPDRSPWVSIDYRTPELAARTLLEALRRDEPEVVYASLSHAYRDRLGLDQATTVLAWERVRASNPGLHVAGYAEVPPATALAPDRARVALRIEGRRVDLDLVRQRKWEVRWRRPSGTLAEPGGNLPSFAAWVTIEEGERARTATLRLQPFTFAVGADLPDAAAIEFAGLVAEWKVDDISMPADP